MSTPPFHPRLTPQLCFSSSALQDFLRFSRSAIDDSITSSLNALLAPSQRGFDPSSTSTRQPRSSHKISSSSCLAFRNQVLFPAWQSRDKVLEYCAQVAAEIPSEWSNQPTQTDSDAGDDRIEEGRGKTVKQDYRADPYETRPVIKDGKKERLLDLIANERGVEKIVRSRSWGVMRARCASVDGDDDEEDEGWTKALSQWGRKS